MSPDFLAIGHVVRDITPEGFRLGGTVTYGALTAQKLGHHPAVVTSVGPELVGEMESSFAEIPVHKVPSVETTTFQNTYLDGERSQRVSSVAGPIRASDVPRRWRAAPMVLLGPIAGEVSADLPLHFADSVIVASLQGWVRGWDGDGKVTPRTWEGRELLPRVDAAVVSSEDVNDDSLIDRWAELTPVLIVTRGERGAALHLHGRQEAVPAFPAGEVDPTGAGDVFAAAFLVKYHETRQALESARFASCAASLSVESEGAEGIPTRAQVEERLPQARM